MSEAGEGDSRKLRILLIAYEFPPSPSPQSLRWAYLSNRLAAMGHEMHVLAPDIGGSMEGLPDPGPGVQIHRTRPGPVRGLLARLARKRSPTPASAVVPAKAGTHERSGSTPAPSASVELPAAESATLNWRGRLLERVKQVASWFVFPDLRGEWTRPARRALAELLHRVDPDVVVSSHEPASTLALGLEAKRRGFRWVADLGDPVLTSYTRRRWRGRAHALEKAVMREAYHVVVTAERAHALLRDRHGGIAPVTVVTQGFDEHFPTAGPVPSGDGARLELLYTGRFYRFRNPRTLVDAVLKVPGVRLNIASGDVPDWLVAACRAHPDKVRLLGRVAHRSLLGAQRHADVLVNLANADPCQVPGKFYEYLGAGRPVLHVSGGQGPDAAADLIARLRRGWACQGEMTAIAGVLARLAESKQAGKLTEGLDLDRAPVASWSWRACAATLAMALQQAVPSGVKNP